MARENEFRRNNEYTAGLCRQFDTSRRAIRKIYDKVQARQDSEKTDILITSDHGEMLGDGGMLYKSTPSKAQYRFHLYIEERTEKNRENILNQ